MIKHQIINHGPEHEQYFQGCDTAYSGFDHVATGIGDNAREAYDAALDQVCEMGIDENDLPKRPKGIRKSDRVLKRWGDDCYWYVSIRY